MRNSGRPGAADGPAALRRALANLAWHGGDDARLYDAGDVSCRGDELEAAQSGYAERLAALLRAGHFPIGLGGGHEIALGAYLGLERAFDGDPRLERLGIVNFDAHLDLRDAGGTGSRHLRHAVPADRARPARPAVASSATCASARAKPRTRPRCSSGRAISGPRSISDLAACTTDGRTAAAPVHQRILRRLPDVLPRRAARSGRTRRERARGPRRAAAPRGGTAAHRHSTPAATAARAASCCSRTSPNSTRTTIPMAARRARRHGWCTNWRRSGADALAYCAPAPAPPARPRDSAMRPTAPALPILSLLLAALLVSGCSRKQPEPEPTTAPAAATTGAEAPGAAHLPPGIDWFAGDVDAAFAAAKAANKPMFLYWGAEWCPPCAQIKSTIFNKREFQERSRLFVPVYLDGDTPSAQRYGERFGIVGYPTMILFRAGRHRDHAPARHRGHRALRDHPRRGARRRAAGRRDPRGGIDRRRGHAERLAPARLLLLGHGQRPHPARGPARRHVPSPVRALPARTAARVRPPLLRVPRRAAARSAQKDKPALDGLERAAARRELLDAAGGYAGGRRPTSTTCCTGPRTSSACCPTPARPSAAS